MPYTYNKLRGRIIEIYGSQGNFADTLCISKNSVSRKMNGKTGFSQKDMALWGKLLHITKEEYSEYFFN